MNNGGPPRRQADHGRLGRTVCGHQPAGGPSHRGRVRVVLGPPLRHNRPDRFPPHQEDHIRLQVQKGSVRELRGTFQGVSRYWTEAFAYRSVLRRP